MSRPEDSNEDPKGDSASLRFFLAKIGVDKCHGDITRAIHRDARLLLACDRLEIGMTYFPDLSPYAYGHHAHPGVVHVGWLDNVHPFPLGTVEARLIERMKRLAAKPLELYRGKHICELCVEPPDLEKRNLANWKLVVMPAGSSDGWQS